MNLSLDSATYIILRVAVLLVLFITGYLIVTDIDKKRHYWLTCMPAIGLYSLVEGLRYDRGFDYMHYKETYENALQLNMYMRTSHEPVFTFVNGLLRSLGFSYPFAFIVYSFMLITAVFYLLRKRKPLLIYAAPLFFIATIVQSENLIRSFFAFALVLFALTAFIDKAYKLFFVLMTLAVFSHSSVAIFVPFILLFKWVENPFKSLYVVLGFYLFSAYWKTEWWGQYEVYLKLLNFGDSHYQLYIDNSSQWFSGDVDGSDIGMLAKFRLHAFNVLLIVFGYKVMTPNNEFGNDRLMFNLFLIGALTQGLTHGMEIPSRISLYFYMLWFYVLARILDDAFRPQQNKHSVYYNYTCIFLLLNAVYQLISPMMNLSSDKIRFVWDVVS